MTILIKYLVGIQQEHGIQSLTAGFFVMVHKASMLLSHYLWLVKVSSEDFIQAVGFLQEELAYSKSQGWVLIFMICSGAWPHCDVFWIQNHSRIALV